MFAFTVYAPSSIARETATSNRMARLFGDSCQSYVINILADENARLQRRPATDAATFFGRSGSLIPIIACGRSSFPCIVIRFFCRKRLLCADGKASTVRRYLSGTLPGRF